MEALLRGLTFGFMIAMPVGPIGLLCIRRSLAHGWRAGFVSGLGAATADTLYAMLAAVGLSFLSTFQRPAALVGGFLLLYLAYQTATSAPVQAATVKSSHLYWSTVALTITNPATIIVFLGLFAGNTGISTQHGLAVWELVAGVGLGSALWWLLLASISAYVGRAMSATSLVWVNRISGVVIGAFGVVAIGSYFS